MKFIVLTFFLIGAFPAGAQPPSIKQPPEIKETLSFPRYSEFFSVGEVKGKIAPAKAIYLPKPVFADEAREAGVDGKVRVEIVIAADGTVSATKAVSGSEELFPAAERAAASSRFLPPKSEINAYLEYEFLIRKPGWFLVAYDLYAVAFSNPGVIRKAFPEDWSEELELASRLQAMQKALARRPVLTSVSRSGSVNSTSVQATVLLPPSTFDLKTTASELIEKVRRRLSADSLSLWQFEFGEAIIQAQLAVRNPAMQPYATGLLARFANDSGSEIPAAFVDRLREFLAVESSLLPGIYRDRLSRMANDFRLYEEK